MIVDREENANIRRRKRPKKSSTNLLSYDIELGSLMLVLKPIPSPLNTTQLNDIINMLRIFLESRLNYVKISGNPSATFKSLDLGESHSHHVKGTDDLYNCFLVKERLEQISGNRTDDMNTLARNTTIEQSYSSIVLKSVKISFHHEQPRKSDVRILLNNIMNGIQVDHLALFLNGGLVKTFEGSAYSFINNMKVSWLTQVPSLSPTSSIMYTRSPSRPIPSSQIIEDCIISNLTDSSRKQIPNLYTTLAVIIGFLAFTIFVILLKYLKKSAGGTKKKGLSDSEDLYYDTVFNNWSNNLDNRLTENEKESEKESSYKYSTIYDVSDIISEMMCEQCDTPSSKEIEHETCSYPDKASNMVDDQQAGLDIREIIDPKILDTVQSWKTSL